MKGESRSGVSQEANSAALTVRVAWIWRRSRSRRGSQRRTSRLAASFCRPQPPAAETGSSASSVASRAGASRTSSARRVGADEEGEAVALEPAPLVLAGAELVVVVDDRGRLDPEACRRAAAAAARGRRPRGRGRSARGSRRPRRQVAQRDRQAGAGEGGDLAGRRRRGDRLAVAAGPDDAGEVDRVAGGVDPRPRRRRRPAPARRPSRGPRSQGRRIASPKPGSGAASGLRMTSRSPLAAAAPALQPAAKPALRAGLRRAAPAGASSRDRLGGAVAGVVVDDDQLVALAQLRQQRRQGPAPAPRGCSRRRSGRRASGAPARRLFGHPRRCERRRCWRGSYFFFFAAAS